MTGNPPNSLSLNEEKSEEQDTDAMVGEQPVCTGAPVSRGGAVRGPQQAVATTRAAPVEESALAEFGSGGGVSSIPTTESIATNVDGSTGFFPPPLIDSNSVVSSKTVGALAPPVMMAPSIPIHRQASPPQLPLTPRTSEPTIISGTCTSPSVANKISTMGSSSFGGDGPSEDAKAVLNSAPHQIDNLEVAEQEILTNIQELQRKLMELKTDETQVCV